MLISFWVVCFSLFASSFLLGHVLCHKLIYKETGNDTLSTLFLSTLFGFLFLVTAYSVFMRGIYSSLLPCFLVFLFVSWKNFAIKLPVFTSKFLVVFLVFGVWCFYFLHVLTISQDVLFYSLIAKSFRLVDNENYFLVNNHLSESFRGYTPYHYGEMWASDALSWITKIPQVALLPKVVYPLSSFLVLLGIAACTNSAMPLWKRLLYSFVFLHLTIGVYSLLHLLFFPPGLSSYLLDLTEPAFYKVLFFSPIIVASVWWSNKNRTISLILLCQAPFFSFITTPAIFGGVLIGLLLFYFMKIHSLKETGLFLLAWLAHILCLLLIKRINTPFHLTAWNFEDLSSFYFQNALFSVLTIRNIITGQCLWVLISLLPLFLLFYGSLKKTYLDHAPAIILASCIEICGILSFAILFPLRDSIQLSYVTWIGVSFLYLLGVASKVADRLSPQKIFIGTCIGVIYISIHSFTFSPHQTYSEDYLETVSKTCVDFTDPKIGSIKKQNGLDAYFLFQQPIKPFIENPQFVGCVPMSQPIPIFQDPLTSFRSLEIEQESAFIEYIQKKHGSFWQLTKVDWQNACCEYIDKFKLDAVVVEKGTFTPSCIEKRAKKIILDSLSGERVFVF